MSAARWMAIGFAVLAALGITGIALAGPSTEVQFAQEIVSPTPTSTPSVSDDTAITLTQSLTGTVTVSDTVASNEKVANAIAQYFDVPLSDVTAQHADGMGYGEIVIAYALAQQTGQPVGDIIGMFEDGQGWGEIAHTLSVKPGRWGVNLGQIRSGHAVSVTTESQIQGAPRMDQEHGPGQNPGNGRGNSKGRGNSNGKGRGH